MNIQSLAPGVVVAATPAPQMSDETTGGRVGPEVDGKHDARQVRAAIDSLISMMSKLSQLFADLLKRLRDIKAQSSAEMRAQRWEQFVAQLASGLQEADKRKSAALLHAGGQIGGGALSLGVGLSGGAALWRVGQGAESIVNVASTSSRAASDVTQGSTAAAGAHEEREGANFAAHTQFRRDASEGLSDDARRVGDDAQQTLGQSVDTIRQLTEFAKQFYASMVPR